MQSTAIGMLIVMVCKKLDNPLEQVLAGTLSDF
jgi:hypothetical protein